jgi:HlyD family secretion protein
MTSAPSPLRRALARWPWALALVALSSGVVYARTRPVAVSTFAVDRGPVLREAIGTGTVESQAVVQLAFTVPGRIAKLSVDEGALVRAGEVVAALEASQESRRVELARSGVAQSTHAVSRSTADLARAKSVLDAALLEERRIRELLVRGAISPAQRDALDERVARARAELSAAEAAEKQSRAGVLVARDGERLERVREDETRIVAPIDGVVVKRLHEPGDVVAPGGTVLVIASLHKVWASVWLDESAFHELRVGQEARVETRGAPGRFYRARVDRIGVEADRETHEVLVDLELLERPAPLVLGQRVDGRVLLEARTASVRVPRAACEVSPARCWVVRAGRITRADVELGLVGTDSIEIRSGLAVGELLVARPRDGSELRLGARVDGAAP